MMRQVDRWLLLLTIIASLAAGLAGLSLRTGSYFYSVRQLDFAPLRSLYAFAVVCLLFLFATFPLSLAPLRKRLFSFSLAAFTIVCSFHLANDNELPRANDVTTELFALGKLGLGVMGAVLLANSSLISLKLLSPSSISQQQQVWLDLTAKRRPAHWITCLTVLIVLTVVVRQSENLEWFALLLIGLVLGGLCYLGFGLLALLGRNLGWLLSCLLLGAGGSATFYFLPAYRVIELPWLSDLWLLPDSDLRYLINGLLAGVAVCLTLLRITRSMPRFLLQKRTKAPPTSQFASNSGGRRWWLSWLIVPGFLLLWNIRLPYEFDLALWISGAPAPVARAVAQVRGLDGTLRRPPPDWQHRRRLISLSTDNLPASMELSEDEWKRLEAAGVLAKIRRINPEVQITLRGPIQTLEKLREHFHDQELQLDGTTLKDTEFSQLGTPVKHQWIRLEQANVTGSWLQAFPSAEYSFWQCQFQDGCWDDVPLHDGTLHFIECPITDSTLDVILRRAQHFDFYFADLSQLQISEARLQDLLLYHTIRVGMPKGWQDSRHKGFADWMSERKFASEFQRLLKSKSVFTNGHLVLEAFEYGNQVPFPREHQEYSFSTDSNGNLLRLKSTYHRACPNMKFTPQQVAPLTSLEVDLNGLPNIAKAFTLKPDSISLTSLLLESNTRNTAMEHQLGSLFLSSLKTDQLKKLAVDRTLPELRSLVGDWNGLEYLAVGVSPTPGSVEQELLKQVAWVKQLRLLLPAQTVLSAEEIADLQKSWQQWVPASTANGNNPVNEVWLITDPELLSPDIDLTTMASAGETRVIRVR